MGITLNPFTGQFDITGGGSGTVTSIAITDSTGILTVTGSPITGSGTITLGLRSETANTVFAAPNGSSGAPTFRSLVAADIPTLPYANQALNNLVSPALNVDLNLNTHKITNLVAGSASTDATNVAQSILTNGINAFTGNQSLGGFTITNSGAPVNPNDLVTKTYVDNFINATSWKTAALVATNANITLSGEQTIDGFLTSSSRVLVKNQTTPSQNGIYVSASGAWSRSSDMNSWTNVSAAAIFIQEGIINGDIGFVCTAQPGGILGTTAITFVQFSSSGAYTADNVTLQLISGVFSVKNNGISNTQLAQMLSNTIKGNNTGSTANASDLTPAQVLTMINGANTTLSNLSTTSINQNLLPSSGGTFNLGAAANQWHNLFVDFVGNSTGGLVIDTGNERLYNIGASWTLDWGAQQLRDGSSPNPLLSIDWNNRNLVDTIGNQQLNWATTGTVSIPSSLLNMNTHKIINVVDPTNAQEAATKNYVDTSIIGVAVTPKKELFTLSSTDITNQYIDLLNVAKIDSIYVVVSGGGIQIEGVSFDNSINYTGGVGSKTRVSFLNGLATGGTSALVVGDVIVISYLF